MKEKGYVIYMRIDLMYSSNSMTVIWQGPCI